MLFVYTEQEINQLETVGESYDIVAGGYLEVSLASVHLPAIMARHVSNSHFGSRCEVNLSAEQCLALNRSVINAPASESVRYGPCSEWQDGDLQKQDSRLPSAGSSP